MVSEVVLALDVIRVFAGGGLLLLTAVGDIETRIARNLNWLGLGLLAITLLVIEAMVRGFPLWSLAGIPFAAVLFLYAVDEHIPDLRTEDGAWDHRGLVIFGGTGFIFLLGLSLSSMDILISDTILPVNMLVIPIVVLIGYGLYYSRILHGGADAKAFMCIALLHPIYPVVALVDTDPLLQLVFPYAMTVLLVATVLAILGYIPMFVRNLLASRGADTTGVPFSTILFGRCLPLDEVRENFHFIMGKPVGGEGMLSYSIFPGRGDHGKVLKDLEEAGYETAWVQTSIPFLVPLAAAFILSAIIHNPLFTLLMH